MDKLEDYKKRDWESTLEESRELCLQIRDFARLMRIDGGEIDQLLRQRMVCERAMYKELEEEIKEEAERHLMRIDGVFDCLDNLKRLRESVEE